VTDERFRFAADEEIGGLENDGYGGSLGLNFVNLEVENRHLGKELRTRKS
jgi:hypothetical protein